MLAMLATKKMQDKYMDVRQFVLLQLCKFQNNHLICFYSLTADDTPGPDCETVYTVNVKIFLYAACLLSVSTAKVI